MCLNILNKMESIYLHCKRNMLLMNTLKQKIRKSKMINSRENKVAQGNAYHTTLYSWAVNNVLLVVMISMDFLGGSAVKNLPVSAGDTSSIPA